MESTLPLLFFQPAANLSFHPHLYPICGEKKVWGKNQTNTQYIYLKSPD